jgi:hypothetical protein
LIEGYIKFRYKYWTSFSRDKGEKASAGNKEETEERKSS